jgi:SAM-dependent methyltransferase
VTWLVPAFFLAVVLGIAINGARLRARIALLPVLDDTAEPVADDHLFLTAEGVVVGEATRRAASAYAREHGLSALDLYPGDLPFERMLDAVRLNDPETFVADRFAESRGPGQALLVTADIASRARVERLDRLDPVRFLRSAEAVKRCAFDTMALVVAPHLRSTRPQLACRYAYLKAVFSFGAPYIMAIELVQYAVLAAGVVIAPLWGGLALVAYSAQPWLALVGTSVHPRDLRWRPLLRLPLRLVDWVCTAGGRWQADEDGLADRLRPEYENLLAYGLPRFFESRRDDCPMCGSSELSDKVRVGDLYQHKPGIFTLERCGDCKHVFQNPRLSLKGLDFYYKDFYDGLGERQLEFVFGHNSDGYEQRARAVAPFAEPARWLDVGTGHGHFCLAAREIWPNTWFDGLDMSDSIEEAERRGWVHLGYRGLFPELAGELSERYDVVSMHHYLEHTREPVDEIASAYKALEAGGHVIVEVPDPECPYGWILGRYWVPWFQPQHQHLIPIDNLEGMLREHGFEPVARQRGPAHQANDLVFAVYLLVGRLAPTTDHPWSAPTRWYDRLRRGVVFTAALPVLLAALAGDRVMRSIITGSNTRRGNTYRVVARKV